ncbi:MAG TPA: kelch repeat-containing protein, partial [Polyangiales bacterium]|nr:kelch repeat-containing protein [Polyangiales bacterium]
YDERRKRMVVFGGDATNSSDDGQTWELDRSSWQERAVQDAAAIRIGGTTRHMAYDAARGVTLYISPLDSISLDQEAGTETLIYDGASWQSVAHNPEFFGRTAYAIAYDAARERTVVFSGAGEDFNSEPLADTWEWDGARWLQAQVEAAPPPRRDHAMAFDATRSHIVMFGGHATSPGVNEELADTWAWDGRNWTQFPTTQAPPARSEHALAFDPERGRVVLFGGVFHAGNRRGPLADTWEWDGSAWTQIISASSPLPRLAHSMVYDSERKRVLLFGGEAPLGDGPQTTLYGDLWSWDGTNWVELQLDALPSLQEAPSLAYDPERKQTLMFGGSSLRDTEQQVTVTWLWDGEQWLRKTVPAPLQRNRSALAFDPDSRRLLLNGGVTRTGDLSDTWAWDGAAWRRVAEDGPRG